MQLSSCPICKKSTKVKEYYCETCDISFRGSFEPAWSQSLSPAQLEFVRVFIIVQGNIKEMEKRFGISYPTVKNRLSEIIRLIAPKDISQNEDFGDVLNDLEEGFICVDEAINIIEQRRKQ